MVGCLPQAATGSQQRRLSSRGMFSSVALTIRSAGEDALDEESADLKMRLKGTVWFMPVLVASFLTYAWTAGSHVNIAGIVISLFFAGLSVMLIYASTLAYLVDVNPVRYPSTLQFELTNRADQVRLYPVIPSSEVV